MPIRAEVRRMKVVCDNCRAVYKVPDDKLVKPINKATCRNCNHRMLIPKPKPNADPEERTLVTAVAPTPPGAPSRTGEPSRPSADDVRVGTPLLTTRTDNGLEVVPERVALDPVPHVPAGAWGTPSTSAGGGQSSLFGLSTNGPHTPVSAGNRTPVGAGSVRRPTLESMSRSGVHPQPLGLGTAEGAPPRVRAAASLHDPADDMAYALGGTTVGLVGGFLLAVMTVWYSWFFMLVGLLLTFGGGFVSALVLITGARGRRPARVQLSLGLGTIVAVLMSISMVLTKWIAVQIVEPAEVIEFTNEGLASGVSSPVEPAPPAPPPAPEIAAPAPVAPKPAPAPRPAPKPEPVVEAPAPEPAPAPVAEEPEPRAPATLPTVPVEVVHALLSKDMGVKRCFVPLLQQGKLPRVDVKFNILASGVATDVHVAQEEFVGTELESCLGEAIGKVGFPATKTGQAVTYPFVVRQ